MLKEKNGQSRMLNTMNLSFQNESEIKFFFRKEGRKEKEMKGNKRRKEVRKKEKLGRVEQFFLLP